MNLLNFGDSFDGNFNDTFDKKPSALTTLGVSLFVNLYLSQNLFATQYTD